MSKIKAIIFDFDGVIVESMDIKGRAFAHLFRAWPEQIDKIIAFHMEHGGLSRFEKFAWIYQNLLHQPLSKEQELQLGREFHDYVYEEVIKCPLVKGAYEFLNKYYQKLSFFVVSGTPEKEMRSIIRERDLDKYFVEVFGSPEKKGELNLKILERYKFRAQEVIAVGDTIDDYEGARISGIEFVGRVNTENPFKNLGVKNLIHDLVELDNIFEGKHV